MGLFDKKAIEALQTWVAAGQPPLQRQPSILDSPFTTVLGPGAAPVSDQAAAMEACKVRIPSKGDRKDILANINAQSLDQYDTDDKGYLRKIGTAPADGKPRLQEYSDDLNRMIALDGRTAVLSKSAFFPRARGAGSFNQTPEMVSLDREYGGGVMLPEGKDGKDVRIVVSGNAAIEKWPDGRTVEHAPDDILRHEVMNHAARVFLGPPSGSKYSESDLRTKSTIDYDNEMRRKLGKAPRPPDNKHPFLGPTNRK